MSSQSHGRQKSAPSAQTGKAPARDNSADLMPASPLMALQIEGAGNQMAQEELGAQAEQDTPERLAVVAGQGGQDAAAPPAEQPEWAKPLEEEAKADPGKMGASVAADARSAQEQAKLDKLAELEARKKQPEATEAQDKRDALEGVTCEDPFQATIDLLKVAISLLLVEMFADRSFDRDKCDAAQAKIIELTALLTGVENTRGQTEGRDKGGPGRKPGRDKAAEVGRSKGRPGRDKGKPGRDKGKPGRDKGKPGREPGGNGDRDVGLTEVDKRPRHVKHRDSEIVRTGGGFTIECKLPEIIVYNPEGKKITRIWGDPHVDADGDGKDDWHFGQDSTFVLPDGTKMCLDTEPNEKDEWYVVGADIILGYDRFHVGKGGKAGMTDDGQEWDAEHADAADHATAGVFAMGDNGKWAKMDMETGAAYEVENESWAQYMESRDVTGGKYASGQLNNAQRRAIFGNNKQNLG